MLELNHIHKYYNAGTVNEMCLFNDFSLSIEDGQFVSVVGSNGSGKTSMLNLICGRMDLSTTFFRQFAIGPTGECRETEPDSSGSYFTALPCLRYWLNYRFSLS